MRAAARCEYRVRDLEALAAAFSPSSPTAHLRSLPRLPAASLPQPLLTRPLSYRCPDALMRSPDALCAASLPPICGRYAACAVYAVVVAICCAIRCFPLHSPLLSRCFVAIINSCYPVAPSCCIAHAAGHPSGGVSHVVRTFDPQNAPGARTPRPRMRPTGGEASSAEGTYPQPPPP